MEKAISDLSQIRQLLNSGHVWHKPLVENTVNIEVKGQVHENDTGLNIQINIADRCMQN